MKNITLQPCLPKTYTYEITDKLQVSIRLSNNVLAVPPEALFSMAARKNPKRSFLFVSKLLGKHLPVNPYISLLAGAALALCYANLNSGSISKYSAAVAEAFNNPEKAAQVFQLINPIKLSDETLFIGFAETATALGHAMFNSFTGKAYYIHTTREVISGHASTLNFAEEHSHAVSHYCYLDFPILQEIKTVVLVDDEITTGKTALNIIRECFRKFGCRDYVVATLLDWRSAAAQGAFASLETELQIRIRTVALLQGLIEVSDQGTVPADDLCTNDLAKELPQWQKIYFSEPLEPGQAGPVTARLGINTSDKVRLEALAAKIGSVLRAKRAGQKILCVGTGEFMYLPMRIASLMGPGVCYQSTTRSPIYPYNKAGYAAQNGCVFVSPDDPEVHNYLYNVPLGYYDELYLFLERDFSDARLASMLGALSQLGIARLYLVICGK